MFLGIDIGGTKLLALARDSRGRTIGRWCVRTGADFSPARAIEVIAGIVAEAGAVQALGIGFPGLVDQDAGRIRSSVMLPGWDGFPLREALEERLELPCPLDNDVNNAARAEHRIRRARRGGEKDLLFVAIGTGIGGALVLDGAIWHGSSGLAGEIGHFGIESAVTCGCGRVGCIGAMAGGLALEAQADESEVAERVLASAISLGSVIADAMNLLNLPLVVLGGGVAAIGEPYRRAVESGFRNNAMREVSDECTVELAAAGYDAGAFGGTLLAEEALESPGNRRAARPSLIRRGG